MITSEQIKATSVPDIHGTVVDPAHCDGCTEYANEQRLRIFKAMFEGATVTEITLMDGIFRAELSNGKHISF